MESVKSFQVLVSPVHNIIGPRFRCEHVQSIHIVNFTVGYVDECRNGSAQIDQGVQLYSGLGSAELGPREQFQTEVNGRRVQCVNRLSQIGDSRIFGVKFACFGDKYLGEVSEDPLVPALIGICKSCTANGPTNSQMVQFRWYGSQTRLDVSKAFPSGQLSKCHAQKLIETGERATWTPLGISGYAVPEVGQRKQVHDLREHQPTHMHTAPCQGADVTLKRDSKLKSIQPSMMYLRGKYPSFVHFLNFLTGQQ